MRAQKKFLLGFIMGNNKTTPNRENGEANALEKDLQRIRDIILNRLKGYRFQLFFFVSHARKEAGRTSDIDVGLLPLKPIPPDLLSEIREELSESSIPYPVDLVDLSRASNDFVERVKQDGISWTG